MGFQGAEGDKQFVIKNVSITISMYLTCSFFYYCMLFVDEWF